MALKNEKRPENQAHRATTASRSVLMILPDYNINPVIHSRPQSGEAGLGIRKMKILLCVVLCMLSVNCSGVLLIREYSPGRRFSQSDLQKVAHTAQKHGFKEEDSKNWVKAEGVVDFLSMRLNPDGETLVFGSCLLPGPTLYVYPGPDRWTKSKEAQVDSIVSHLEEQGLTLQLMRPDFRCQQVSKD